MAEPRDFYEVLGVARNATAEEIQRAYRKLARRWHPDLNKSADAADRFKEITEANEVLSDPDSRKRYDAFGADFRRVPPDVDPDEWARRGAAPRGSGFGEEGIPFDIDDLFGGLFGGRARSRGPSRGANQEVTIELTVEEAFRGGPRSIQLQDGRSFTVTIPPGVNEGQRIRLSGQGGQGRNGGSPGDLHLIVQLRPDRRYRLEGRNLTVQLPISPWEAALGTSATVLTPAGTVNVRVPPGTSSGRRLRLRGKGLGSSKGGAGDLYAETRIVVPKSLTDKERELFEELAKVSSFDPRSVK